MDVEIRFTQRDFDGLKRHFFQPDGLERAAYLFAGPNASPGALSLCVREVWPVPADAYAQQSSAGIEVQAGFIKQVLEHAYQSGLSLLEAHSHPFCEDEVAFSGVDMADEARKYPYVAAKIPHIQHGTMVFGQGSIDAHLYDPQKQKVWQVNQVTVLDVPLRRFIPTSNAQASLTRRRGRILRQSPDEGERYSRQILAFGEAGQKRLREVQVAIVGVGSVGMSLAQHLALLGVRKFILVDPDRVELTNLNRLVGATPKDAKRQTLKVDVAARVVRAAAPGAKVLKLPLSILDAAAHRVVRTADVLFGGTDNHSSRLVLNDRLAVQYLIPYIDVGTGLEADSSGRIVRGGGWVRLVLPGEWCLHCIDAIDREQATRELLPPAYQEALQARGYLPGVPAPSVFFLNNLLASLAISEFMNLVTGYKPAHHLILYDVLKQRATPVEVQARGDCACCSSQALLAMGDLEPFPRYGENPALTIPVIPAEVPQPDAERHPGGREVTYAEL